MRHLILTGSLLAGVAAAAGAEETYRVPGAAVSHDADVPAAYVRAIARTVALGRAIAARRFGLDMPETIVVSIRVDPKQLRLFNDGGDRIYLTIRSVKDLGKPGGGAPLMVYGLCHEVGHLGMYRVVRQRDWMTTAAAEGWAHYIGGRIVDDVHAAEGDALWPEPHNYLLSGTRRLTRQLAGKDRSPTVEGAGLWRQLGSLLDDKGFARLFAAWGRVKVDPDDPARALGAALPAAGTAKDLPRLAAWWKKAAGVFAEKRGRSAFPLRTVSPGDLAGTPLNLSHDDGKFAGRRSMAGGGHAVRFEVTGEAWYLTAVGVHGARYGSSEGTFRVWLCDGEFNVVSEFEFPFAAFQPGSPKWVALPVRPTNVPEKFIVCVAFNPTGTKGVFVSHDAEGEGHSLCGLPGKPPAPLAKGDWLIRVQLRRLKATKRPITPDFHHGSGSP